MAAKLKAAQLAAEIAEMRRKIQVQELRQAGKPVPAVRTMPVPDYSRGGCKGS